MDNVRLLKRKRAEEPRGLPFAIVFPILMVRNIGQAGRFAPLQSLALIFLLLLVPIVLSNHPAGAILRILLFVVMFFFPGYLMLTIFSRLTAGPRILLSPILSIACITTASRAKWLAAAASARYDWAITLPAFCTAWMIRE